MLQSHKISFYIILALIFLIPIFFIPGGILSLGMAKSALLVIGVSLAALVFVVETWLSGRVVMPRSYLAVAAVLLPVVYWLSAILATPSSLSLFGYGFEAGTFGYMLVGVAFLLLVAMGFVDTRRTLKALTAFFASVSILAIFVAIKILLGGDALNMGVFFGNMGNPLGSWTDLAVVFGLLAVFSSLTLGMVPTSGLIRVTLYVIFSISTALIAVLSFQAALIFTLIASIAMFLYFKKGERGEMGKGVRLALPLILGVVSLVFLVNPVINPDGTKLGAVVSNAFEINNTEIRPSFSATLGISKAVLTQTALLGSGPNTFGRDWLIYRPSNINLTPFWAATFPSGAGFLPTQIATTGILGSALWLVFFVLLITLAVRALTNIPESRGERFTIVFTLFASVFLWGTSFLYAPSDSVLMLAFVFTGLFLGAVMHAGITNSIIVDLRQSSQSRLAAALLVLMVIAGAVATSWLGVEKTVSAYYFNNAVKISNNESVLLSDVENEIIKAINSSPTDIYYVALSRLNFSRAQAVAQSATGTPEENRTIFDESIRRSVEAARLAVATNPAGFENWVQLGTVYGALVPEPLQVEGAYENAAFAFQEAMRRNPSNPELPLLMAQLEINKGEVDRARAFVRNSIALKEDYADAYLMLAQLEIGEGNTDAAIASTESLAVLLPENSGVHFELGVLKYSNEDFEEALQSLDRALILAPNHANALYYKGLTLAELGRFEEAKSIFETLSQSNPNSSEVKSALDAVMDNKVPEPLPDTTATAQE